MEGFVGLKGVGEGVDVAVLPAVALKEVAVRDGLRDGIVGDEECGNEKAGCEGAAREGCLPTPTGEAGAGVLREEGEVSEVVPLLPAGLAEEEGFDLLVCHDDYCFLLCFSAVRRIFSIMR